MDDQNLGTQYLSILEWAQDNDCFLSSTTMNPVFGIANSQGHRIFSVYQTDGLWPWFDTAKFAGQEERDRYVKELKAAGLLEAAFDPDDRTTTKISVPDQAAIERLLSILASQIA